MTNGYEIYKQQDLETSNPREIVEKLYGGAALALRRASADIGKRRIESANKSIIKAENILIALDKALDMQFPISEQLHALYTYMVRQLMEANRTKDAQIVDRVAGWLSDFRETWEQAFSPKSEGKSSFKAGREER